MCVLIIYLGGCAYSLIRTLYLFPPSHVHAAISKDSDFRREKTEILLLDTGAGVNLAGEDIIKDSGVKISSDGSIRHSSRHYRSV